MPTASLSVRLRQLETKVKCREEIWGAGEERWQVSRGMFHFSKILSVVSERGEFIVDSVVHSNFNESESSATGNL